jgi:hypothetical protein
MIRLTRSRFVRICVWVKGPFAGTQATSMHAVTTRTKNSKCSLTRQTMDFNGGFVVKHKL